MASSKPYTHDRPRHAGQGERSVVRFRAVRRVSILMQVHVGSDVEARTESEPKGLGRTTTRTSTVTKTTRTACLGRQSSQARRLSRWVVSTSSLDLMARAFATTSAWAHVEGACRVNADECNIRCAGCFSNEQRKIGSVASSTSVGAYAVICKNTVNMGIRQYTTSLTWTKNPSF